MSSDEFRQPPIPDGLSPEDQQLFLRQYGLAQNLKRKTGASYLYAAASRILGPDVSPESFILYLDQLLDEAGQPADPIERMLIEQIVMAHHNIGRLHAQAAAAESLDHVKVYNAAAARLLAEFRRASLALKKYREPTTPKNFMLVKQQNVAHHQQVAFLDQEGFAEGQDPAPSPVPKEHRNNELVSKGTIEHAPPKDSAQQLQPQSRRGGETESVETKGTQR